MRRLVLAIVLVALAPLAEAQFVAPGSAVPVVANLPGLGGTFWRSDVSVVNIADTDTSVVMLLYPDLSGGAPAFDVLATEPLPIAAGTQVTFANVVQTRFGLVDAKGGLVVYSTTGAPLVISSRTYTYDTSTGGSYGQDVSSVLVSDRAWANGLEHDSLYRTNLGIFWPWNEAGHFQVTVFRADGTVAGSGNLSFAQSGLLQYSLSEFGVGTLLDGYVEIRCTDSTAIWYAYASRVDQISGDAVFRVARGYQIQ